MERILVVGDAGVLATLAERFGAGGSVCVSGAPSKRQALVRALIERPSLVVCSERSLEGSVGELATDLRKLGLDDAHLVCVCASDPGDVPASDRLLSACTPEELFEVVAGLLSAPPARPARRCEVQLLASMARVDCLDHHPQLANVVEIGADELRIESPLMLELGQRLSLSFFLPGSSAGDTMSGRVSLTCRVTDAADEMRILYDARIEFIDEAARRALDAFVTESRKSEES